MLKEHYGDQLQLIWKSYLLRPQKKAKRDLDKFRDYTKSWQKVASDEPSGNFQTWATNEGPPSHSIPPHVVSKAAAEIDEDAFERIHEALLKAYFTDNRDIADEATLRSIWEDVGLKAEDFELTRDPKFEAAVIADHNEAAGLGALGAPAFRMAHQDVAMVGLHPMPVLTRWIDRVIAGEV